MFNQCFGEEVLEVPLVDNLPPFAAYHAAKSTAENRQVRELYRTHGSSPAMTARRNVLTDIPRKSDASFGL